MVAGILTGGLLVTPDAWPDDRDRGPRAGQCPIRYAGIKNTGLSIRTPIVMQGIPLLVLTFALLYLGRKLLLFVKALQAIQYAIDNNLIVFTTFLYLQYLQVPPREANFHIVLLSKCHSTENKGGYSWNESFIRRETQV